jgi:hypothetical protein
MKTIAVMTMAFLPATFFCRPFCHPVSEMGPCSSCSRQFLVYWAFAIPATVLVFGLWLLLTSWKSKRRPLRGSTIHCIDL